MSSNQVREVATAAPPHPSPFEVQGQLQLILVGAPFRSAPRMRDLLTYVVTEALAGHGHRINERTIAVEALGRPATFDPRVDPAVRVLAGRVRSALDLYYRSDGAHDPVCIDIPKGGYVPRFRPVAPTPLQLVTPAPSDLPRVAVVVFDSVGPDHRPTAIAETVVVHLSHLGGLCVLGPLHNQDAPGADYILRGSIHSLPRGLRVTARLIFAATGETIWSDVLEQPSSDTSPLDAEDDLASLVAGTIGDYLGVVHRHAAQRRDLDADVQSSYAALLSYFDYLSEIDLAKVEPTVVALEAAVDREPGNALLAGALAGMYLARHSRDHKPEAAQQARQAVRQGLAIEPNNPQASTILVTTHLVSGSVEAARVEFDRLVPIIWHHPTLLFLAGVCASVLGDTERCLELTRRSMRLNPNHPGYRYLFLAVEEYRNGNLEAALHAAERLRSPGWGWAPAIRAAVLFRMGRTEDAVIELQHTYAEMPDFDQQARRVFAEDLLLDGDLVEQFLDDLDAVGAFG